MTICERVLELLKAKGIMKKTLAEDAGVSQSTLHTWLHRNEDFPASCVPYFANTLGVSVAYLLTGEEDPRSQIPDDYVQLTENERFIVETLRTLDREGELLIQGKIIEEARRVKMTQGNSASAADGRAV